MSRFRHATLALTMAWTSRAARLCRLSVMPPRSQACGGRCMHLLVVHRCTHMSLRLMRNRHACASLMHAWSSEAAAAEVVHLRAQHLCPLIYLSCTHHAGACPLSSPLLHKHARLAAAAACIAGGGSGSGHPPLPRHRLPSCPRVLPTLPWCKGITNVDGNTQWGLPPQGYPAADCRPGPPGGGVPAGLGGGAAGHLPGRCIHRRDLHLLGFSWRRLPEPVLLEGKDVSASRAGHAGPGARRREGARRAAGAAAWPAVGRQERLWADGSDACILPCSGVYSACAVRPEGLTNRDGLS